MPGNKWPRLHDVSHNLHQPPPVEARRGPRLDATAVARLFRSGSLAHPAEDSLKRGGVRQRRRAGRRPRRCGGAIPEGGALPRVAQQMAAPRASLPGRVGAAFLSLASQTVSEASAPGSSRGGRRDSLWRGPAAVVHSLRPARGAATRWSTGGAAVGAPASTEKTAPIRGCPLEAGAGEAAEAAAAAAEGGLRRGAGRPVTAVASARRRAPSAAGTRRIRARRPASSGAASMARGSAVGRRRGDN